MAWAVSCSISLVLGVMAVIQHCRVQDYRKKIDRCYELVTVVAARLGILVQIQNCRF